MPDGDVCFAELARAGAAVADVVVVNLHLYGLHVASGSVLLPEHDVVVIDEAHQLEDIMSDTVGVQIGGGRFTNLAAASEADHRRSGDHRRLGRGGAGAARSAAAVPRRTAAHAVPRLPCSEC